MNYRYCPLCGKTLVISEVAGQQRPKCFFCNFVHFTDPKVAVGVIATKNKLVLLQKRKHNPGKGKWSFPAGYVDSGERVEDAALREVLDETLVKVKLLGLVGVYSEAGSPLIFIVYWGEIVSGEPGPGDESLEAGLFPVDSIPPLAFPHDDQILNDWKNMGAHLYPGNKNWI